jgi:phosphotransferase family enzyme
MIDRQEQILDDTQEPGLPELRATLVRVLGESKGTILYAGAQRIWSRVYRLQFAAQDGTHTLVVKRLGPLEARRGEQVAWNWLPAVGLADGGPGLLAVAASARGDWVWHVYEDLGESALAGRESDTAAVAAAVRLIASIHSRFASHPLLAECRACGAFDISWFAGNVRDAIRSLEDIRPPAVHITVDQAALRGRLLARLRRLQAEQPKRARALVNWGGPETLLHGDLWTSNTFVMRSPGGIQARLIDWDRAGVGPMSYDLSTFLLRFPAERRGWIVDLYRRSLEGDVWELPGISRLNQLCETAEFARYANCVVWPALAITRENAAWGWNSLAEVDRWFTAMQPVIPGERISHLRPVRQPANASRGHV